MASRASQPPELCIEAGRVGRPHGLDGSFYVTGARPRLLELGTRVTLQGRSLAIARRAGTDERPIVRLERIEDRTAAEAVRGHPLMVPRDQAPPLQQDEWWAEELEGCTVVDGPRKIGVVRRLLELPSCEALEVDTGQPLKGDVGQASGRDADQTQPADAERVLVPMVRDAIRRVDVQARTIDVDMGFLEG